MKLTSKVLLGIVIGIALIFGGSLFALQTYLRSPAGADYLLSKARAFLSAQGIQLEYQKAKLDLFANLHFEHLRIIQNTKSTQMEFRARTLDLNYHYSFFSKTLFFESIEADQPHLVFHSENKTPSQSAPSTPTSTTDDSKFTLIPPVKIDLKNFSLKGLNIDYDQRTPENRIQFKTQNAIVRLQLQWLQNHLICAGDYTFPDQTEASYQLKSKAPLEFRTLLASTAEWSASISRENSQWKYEIQPSDFRLTLKDVYLSQLKNKIGTQVRWPKIQMESHAKLLAKSQELFQINNQSIETLESNHLLTTGPLTVDQSQGKSQNQLHFDSQKASLDLNLSQDIQIQLHYDLYHFSSKKDLFKPADIQLVAQAEVSRDFNHVNTQGSASLNEISLFDFDLHGELRNQLEIKGQIGLTLDPKLARIVRALSSAEAAGKWRVQTDLNSKVSIPKKPTDDYRIESNGSTSFEHVRSDDKSTLRFQLKKPMILKHEIGWNQGNLDLNLETLIPELSANGLPTLSGIRAQLKASVQDQTRFSLKEFTAQVDQTLIRMSAEATGDTQTLNFQTQGKTTLVIPKDFPILNGQTVSGQIEFPWTLSIYSGKEIQLDGVMTLANLNWSKFSTRLSPNVMRAHEISGKIPVSEKLFWDGKSIKFSHLVTQNPFERVDFERLQPMFHESDPLRISKVGFEEKDYGPFMGFFSIRQNMIFVHKFEFNLGEGRSDGELFFDAYPKNFQLGILTRLTGLNLNKILPQKYLPKSSNTDEKVSGRSGLVMNFNNGSIDGRIDVTEIGRNQLITLINALDPRFENEQMNNARFALGIAYPSFIQMSFQQGYMNMGFQLQGALNREFMFRGIPLYSWISGAKAEMMKTPKENSSHDSF